MPFKCPMCSLEKNEPVICPSCKVELEEECKSCREAKSKCRC